ncbi:MAG TPA: hypothetical protein VE258_04225 [Ktedonobacterales bacterium]|nr:hypothetical protein [Ktedonobacterales bacterium]
MQPIEHPMPPERRLARRLLTPNRRRVAYLDQRARAILATLTPHEKLGQLLVPIIFPAGPHDRHVTEELRALLAEGAIGGYFITSASGDASQVRAFIGELKAAARLDASVLRILRFKLDWLGAELARDTASVDGEDVA